MRISALSFAILGALLMVTPQPAQAQNPRSWVASPPDGNDGNLCTRSSPCATFNRAQVQTNDGGEINCVDQGEYGRLRVTKSITIDCEAVQGRIVSTDPGSAILVRALVAPTSQVVVLRGLDISGVGIGGVGIGADNVAEVHIEKCVIHDFGLSGSGWGIVGGVIFNPAQQLFVSDTVVRNNGTSSSGGGILIQPGTDNTINRVTLNRVEARENFFGIKADGTLMNGGVINMTVRDSIASGNRSNGIVGTGPASGPAIIMAVKGSTASQNATAGFGVIADGPKTTITLSKSTVMGNINGIGASNGGQLVSYSNNRVSLNATDGSPTSVISAK